MDFCHSFMFCIALCNAYNFCMFLMYIFHVVELAMEDYIRCRHKDRNIFGKSIVFLKQLSVVQFPLFALLM